MFLIQIILCEKWQKKKTLFNQPKPEITVNDKTIKIPRNSAENGHFDIQNGKRKCSLGGVSFFLLKTKKENSVKQKMDSYVIPNCDFFSEKNPNPRQQFDRSLNLLVW